jgi:hypothetical protein
MRCPRIGLPRPAAVQEDWFVIEKEDVRAERQEKFFSTLHEIENRGVGRKVVEALGANLAQTQLRDVSWFEGLGLTHSQQELKQVADAVGEWADGDAVAAHVGYKNDLFCTRDAGISAGNSILGAANRAWLLATFGVVFVTPAELAGKL